MCVCVGVIKFSAPQTLSTRICLKMEIIVGEDAWNDRTGRERISRKCLPKHHMQIERISPDPFTIRTNRIHATKLGIYLTIRIKYIILNHFDFHFIHSYGSSWIPQAQLSTFGACPSRSSYTYPAPVRHINEKSTNKYIN